MAGKTHGLSFRKQPTCERALQELEENVLSAQVPPHRGWTIPPRTGPPLMIAIGTKRKRTSDGRLALHTGMDQKLDCLSSSPAVTCWPWNLDKSLLLEGPHFLISQIKERGYSRGRPRSIRSGCHCQLMGSVFLKIIRFVFLEGFWDDDWAHDHRTMSAWARDGDVP